MSIMRQVNYIKGLCHDVLMFHALFAERSGNKNPGIRAGAEAPESRLLYSGLNCGGPASL